MNNVSTIIEYPFNIFRIYSTCEMRITVMFTVPTCCRNTLNTKIELTLLNEGNNLILLTKNSSRMKYLALITSGSSPDSIIASPENISIICYKYSNHFLMIFILGV